MLIADANAALARKLLLHFQACLLRVGVLDESVHEREIQESACRRRGCDAWKGGCTCLSGAEGVAEERGLR